jgi:mono/diheme cytochrome c family protein
VVGLTAFMGISVIFLTYQSIQEAAPPGEIEGGDSIAQLYTVNCAGCHGESINITKGVNLHDVIAQGSHDGMPAWSADLTTDEVDALAGFIASPEGNQLYRDNCEECHGIEDLISSDPIRLKEALEEGLAYAPHAEAKITEWKEVLTKEERTALLNFLVAPDGQRLFAVNCSSCHGRAIAYNGEEAELRQLISEGGLHLEMPGWRERLSIPELDALTAFVLDPSTSPEGETLYNELCTSCHGDRIPEGEDDIKTRDIIASGGTHETMPVWGEVLTEEQLDALTLYTLESSKGGAALGPTLFADNCASCHGDFGEGGPNPARPDDIIAPISSAEYLKTRDDITIFAIIAQGQPNFGMSPFGSAYGGPLEDEEIDALVAYMRSWENNPPVELPPEIVFGAVTLYGEEIFTSVCAQCHGYDGEGGTGPSLLAPSFRETNSSQEIFESISGGHETTTMIAWGEILTSEQIEELVTFIEALPIVEPGEELPDEVSFSRNVVPIFESYCSICHGTDGGWDASSYDAVMNSGDHGPTVIPGDPDNSLLAQKILGTHEEGDIMPPLRVMSERNIKIIIDWITQVALDN